MESFTDQMTTCDSMSSGSATSEARSIDLATLLEPVAPEIAIVDRWLASNLIDDSPFVEELLAQIFKSGGKRIRPAIVLLASKATSKTATVGRLHIILAVLTELIHTASLVHDDVIDSASLRRGQETVNRKFNDKLAVLLGDLLFAQASICLARLMNPVIVGIYGQVLGDLCAGEIRQMRQQFNTTVDWDGYIQKSVSKTACLFAAGSHSGAILNAAGNNVIADLKSYGLNLGICFQIVDDLLDITGNSAKTGKAVGGDLKSGIVTAPALYILERNDAIGKKLEKLIKTRAVVEQDGLEEALVLIREHGGIEMTEELAAKFARKSKDGLVRVPASIYRDSLEALCDHMLTRSS